MKLRMNQTGFGHVAAVGIVLFLAVAGFAGYKVVTMNRNAAVTPSTQTAASSSTPTSIHSKADLSQAGKALDSSSAQVNSSLNDGALDSDLNDML